MTLLGDVTTVMYACWTLLLAASSLTLLYLLVRRPQYLQHPGAIRWLTASLLLGIAGTVLETVYWAGVVTDAWFHVLAWGVLFVSGAAFAGAVWLFARDVVVQGDRAAPFEEFGEFDEFANVGESEAVGTGPDRPPSADETGQDGGDGRGN